MMGMKNNKIIAIVPAHGASEEILRKNIMILTERHLITHSIDLVLKSKYTDGNMFLWKIT